ncbi:folylpolyglutamate synthase/dihydrofolate synthase family protein [Sphingomonas sp. G-3-2-10]|uniref:bifunctional folylpolyglutamate synthase/dihydrofolate synthase n=1 Tax=Sphingomonas sp. G-3-2-10 TaxID=2728838 RepID=UPI00146AAEFE|nr:folylpolyglutamate synthase/dihydrofolate synthase family protein [Sphingomonas sp. G-3-2-10]NML05294.1 bifunctional folylpolyglutamate synthase/dihydrofolate synthase [Sphingomonas sp. G-3-2-10]
MPDHATSSSPAVQAQLDRLTALSPGADILGLERITALLDRIGNPHRKLPPVFHVAGTNGKGSTCAFLRAALEAGGKTVHVYSSPHLVRFNERIRIAGKLIEDDALAVLLSEVLDHAEGIGASFFEVTTAAAFLAFSRTPADACVIEVGLGGRLDATNVIPNPAITGIAQLGIDHEAFLGNTAEDIAAEKAGIAKRGTMLVTMRYPDSVANRIRKVADAAGAVVIAEGEAWRYTATAQAIRFADARETIVAPLPALAGPHQPANYALALAMLRYQKAVPISLGALIEASSRARWPARMQRLRKGPLTAHLPPDSELWLDGGHNPAAAKVIADAIWQVAQGRPIHLILGMLENKDAETLIWHFASRIASLTAVPVEGHAHHYPGHLAEIAREMGTPVTEMEKDVPTALARLPHGGKPSVVLVLGSLYLAGKVLEANGELPD